MDYRYNFEGNKKNGKKKIIFTIISIIVLILIVSFLFRNSENKILRASAGVVSYPFVKTYDFFENITANIKNLFKDKEMVISENERLKIENETLKYSLLESQKILDENDSLKQQLEIKKAFVHFKIKTSKIVYREHDNWTQTFKIDIGTNDGVKKNQAVVHTEGLVGYISATSENESVVTTILDPSTSVSVNISTINEPAILKGDLSLKSENKLSLTSIPLDAQISINDMLYTSGLGNMYSASIPVGKIVEIKKNKNDINRSAIVEPCVSIRTISEVGVVVE